MKTVAFIPIKFHNQRLPGKNIKLLNGKPLMQYIQETLLQVHGIDDIYVYCSDDRVQDYLIAGVKYLKRPNWLDGDHINANDIFVSFADLVDADIYLAAHATAPFINPKSIECGLSFVKGGQNDSALAVTRLQDFLWIDGKPFNYNPDNIPRTQDLPPIYKETFAFFAYNRDVVKIHHRRVGYNPKLIEVSGMEAVDIDEAEDFVLAETMLKMVKNS